MTTYRFVGKTLYNKRVKGSFDAIDENAFLQRARHEGVFLTSYEALPENPIRYYKLKAVELSDFCKQISDMVSAGIPVYNVIGMIKEMGVKPNLKKVYDKLYTNIQDGNTLSSAMEMCGNAFPGLLVNMIRAGEASGQLRETTLKMASFYEKEHKLYNKVQNAMTYPFILLLLTIVVVMVVFTLVLPNFFDMFNGMELPLITQIVLSASLFMQHHWLGVAVGLVLVVVGTMGLSRTKTIGVWLDKQKISIPIIGKLLRIVYTGRFAHTLSSLYSSGLPLVDAVHVSSTILGNKYISNQFEAINRRIRNGESLADSLQDLDGFNPKLQATIKIGEGTGKLDSMLTSIADGFEFDSENAIARLTSLIEPVMIATMAFVIGGIMISVLLPILSSYQNVGMQ